MDQRISVGRVVVGGLVAGFVVNLGELGLNVWLLGDAWSAALARLGVDVDAPALVLWGAGSFVLGIVGVWIYAAASARYGPGATTALRAGAAVWAAAFFVPAVGFFVTGPFPRSLIAMALGWGLVEVWLAVYLGAWIYREGELTEAS